MRITKYPSLYPSAINRILGDHGIETFTHDGNLYAVGQYMRKRSNGQSVPGEEITDVTYFDMPELSNFLNY